MDPLAPQSRREQAEPTDQPDTTPASVPQAPARRCCICGFTGALLLIKPDEACRLGLVAEARAAWSCLLHYFEARDRVRKSQNVEEHGQTTTKTHRAA